MGMEGLGSKPTIENKEDDMGQTIEKGLESLGDNVGVEVADKIKNLSLEEKKNFFANLVNKIQEAWKEAKKERYEKWVTENWNDITTKDGVRYFQATKKSDWVKKSW